MEGILDSKVRLNDALSARSKDDNGFLIVRDNPIAKAGVFDYLGSELNSQDTEPDAVYKVCRTFENLRENKDLFKGKPIKFTHKWVGGEPNDDKQADGAIYGEVRAQEPYLRADIIIYNPHLIEIIERGGAVELSPAYFADIQAKNGTYNGDSYSFIQDLKSVNHLAVVECGRSGSDLRILDTKPKQGGNMKKSFKDSVAELLKRFKDDDSTQESQDGASVDEILALALKADSEFAGGVSEKAEALKSLLEQLAGGAQDSEQEQDSESESCDEQEPESKQDSEQEQAQDDDEVVGEAEATITITPAELVEIVEKVADSKIAKLQKAMDSKAKRVADTYAEVSKAIGQSFDYTGKSERELYKFGYEAITRERLADGLDSKTAFIMAKSRLASKQSAKQADSKPSRVAELLAKHK